MSSYDAVSGLLNFYGKKREAERRISAVFSAYSYRFIETPAFEPLTVFTGKPDENDVSYKFIGRDGSVLALRPDVTPQIARLVGRSAGAEAFPLRVCYLENVFRATERYQGKPSEFTQAGAELCGAEKITEASAEIIALAVNALLCAGLSSFTVDVGHVGFLEGLLSEIPAGAREDARSAVLRRDFVSVRKTVGNLQTDGATKAILTNLMSYNGGGDFLDEVPARSPLAIGALSELREIHSLLSDYGLSRHINFDLSLSGHLGYYTGVIFRGYAQGAGSLIAEGGEYKLPLPSSPPAPSVGCALRVNELMDALSEQRADFAESPVTIVGYAESCRRLALSCADELRGGGLIIENSPFPADFEKSLSYARKKDADGLMFFENADSARLRDIKSGAERIAKISEILTNS
ncbi:MAG: ATP phosphoribosyltransferase regulatory subunit [Clostridiales bacterium]|jgi:ATP phosphoribosyltransferase regulatory subunit|nr:ATP phosphoribosyltransferase regulatory subunit [Clostridiales bacterium]